ncbi:MAG TPA: TPM domain-containing protein [Casimicrobiaceae bacterium]|nr:TPM domain-containing protein [Casimicrobiaceae bacterium]
MATRIAGVLLALVSATSAVAATWEVQKDGLRPIPPLTSPVTDLTGTLSAAERQALDSKLRNWEARTTNQLVVLMVPTTVPESIEDYSIRVADAWKIGQKGKDNGAIFLIAKDDKRMRIEVGYGFEGVLTDVTSRRIIGETVAPYFKQGQFAAGIDAGVDRIMAIVDKGEPLAPVGKTDGRAQRGGGFDFGTLLVILLVAVPVVGALLRSIFGTLGGSVVGAGIVGAAAWFIAASALIAGFAAVIAFVLILFSSLGGRGGWIPMGGGGWRGGGFGGGGFSGGGGGFGGGGASGGWD